MKQLRSGFINSTLKNAKELGFKDTYISPRQIKQKDNIGLPSYIDEKGNVFFALPVWAKVIINDGKNNINKLLFFNMTRAHNDITFRCKSLILTEGTKYVIN